MKFKENSLTSNVYYTILNNSNMVLNARMITTKLQLTKAKSRRVSRILSKMYKQELIFRTKYQMTRGFGYSLNGNTLEDAYNNYLVPRELTGKEKLLRLIKFQPSRRLVTKLHELSTKYSHKSQCFLASLVAFCMCDGHIQKDLVFVQFAFRRIADAQNFIDDFKALFPNQGLKTRKVSYSNSYSVDALRSSKLAQLLHQLGAPKGHKLKQSFKIPNWIFYGSEDIKKSFLSTAIGNEGSAPSNKKWRIQFVLSKQKEHVESLLKLLNQIRAMLYHFDITTSHIQLRKQEGREYNARFYIKGKANLHQFHNLLEFRYASEKQEVLESLILNGKS